MGWRDELFHAISVNIEDNSREGVFVDYPAIATDLLAMPPADRIALARELLAGGIGASGDTGSEWGAGWDAARSAMLGDTK